MKMSSLSLLLATTFLSTSVFAATTTSEIDAEYLNNLTSPKVTWKEASSSETDTVKINDK